MTKRQKESADRKARPLLEFLNSYDARLLSQWTAEQPLDTTIVRSYLVNAHIVLVTISESGWELFLPAYKENNVTETLLAAEAFLGARPGDESLKYRVVDLNTNQDHGTFAHWLRQGGV